MFNLIKKITENSKINQWLSFGAVCYILMLLIRFTEWQLIISTHSISDQINNWELSGLVNDFYIVSVLLIIVGLIFFCIQFISLKLATFVSIVILLSFLLFHLLLVFYFKESLTPLSVSDIKGMSTDQVNFITEIYGFKMVYLFALIPIIFVLSLLFNWFRLLFLSKTSQLITLTSIAFFICLESIKPVAPTNFDSELKYHTIVNKLYYFTNSYISYISDKNDLLSDDISKNIKDYYNQHNINKTTYLDYPFFNQDEVKDVLSPFFDTSDTPPNIVYIISESLGKQYSGKDAILGSFTPFLDSLADHSLYWSNVVANAERTFGAIPNLMSGLPEGERGFMNLKWNMPDHLSLPLLLKENNNYQTAFYCGAWKQFDNMADYVMFQKFDFVLGKADFKENLIHHENTPDEDFTMKNWGAEDVEVFKQSIDFMSQNYDKNKPFLNLYLSTSFHKPYAYTNQSYFESKAMQIIKNKIKLSQQQKYLKQQTDFAAIIYADYSMQQLFEMYKKAGIFDNTIFIIVGDHSLKFMNDNPRLEKYHVPLLIYSPLLKRTKRIKSIVSQKDVPSAIQALLKNTYSLNLPNFSISQSDNLDTLGEFSFQNNEFPMMYSNKRLQNYIQNNYLLSDDILFKIGENLSIKRTKNDKKLTELQNKLKTYKAINAYVCNNNKLIPNEIYNQYSTINYQLDYTTNFTFYAEKNKDKPILSFKEYYSKPKSIECKHKMYFSLLDSFKLDLSNRVRIVVKYKIYSPSGYIPNFVITSKIDDEIIEKKPFYVNKNTENLISTNKQNWQGIEAEYWVEKGKNRIIDIFIFNSDKAQLFIDDLDIKIRNF